MGLFRRLTSTLRQLSVLKSILRFSFEPRADLGRAAVVRVCVHFHSVLMGVRVCVDMH